MTAQQRLYIRRVAAGLCIKCGEPNDSTTSKTCRSCYAQEAADYILRRNRDKARVLELLGDKCSCVAEGAECWHQGECMVQEPKILTVHHIDGGGQQHRRSGGRSASTKYGNVWATYRKSLEANTHRLRLLCYNCHMILDHRKGAKDEQIE